jgi:hypothetical protein
LKNHKRVSGKLKSTEKMKGDTEKQKTIPGSIPGSQGVREAKGTKAR